jgi:hypothetical protein
LEAAVFRASAFEFQISLRGASLAYKLLSQQVAIRRAWNSIRALLARRAKRADTYKKITLLHL